MRIDLTAVCCKLTYLVSLSARSGDIRTAEQTHSWVHKNKQATVISGVNGWL